MLRVHAVQMRRVRESPHIRRGPGLDMAVREAVHVGGLGGRQIGGVEGPYSSFLPFSPTSLHADVHSRLVYLSRPSLGPTLRVRLHPRRAERLRGAWK